MPEFILLIFFTILIIFFYRIVKRKKRNQTQNPEQKLENLDKEKELKLNTEPELDLKQKEIPLYSKKKLITKNELIFYNKLKNVVKNKYLVQTQVNLATIIKKNYDNFRANELCRNIDFGIFDKNTYELLLLIELNDSSHKIKSRYIRDQKVKRILTIANIPLITFYSSYSNTDIYIFRRIKGILNKLNNFD